MATNKVESENRKEELKRLGFVRICATNFLLYAAYLYEYAKENSGRLGSGVRTVEATVTTVLGPVYDKYKHVPHQVLVFLDNKVDEAAVKLDPRLPASVKKTAVESWETVEKAITLPRAMMEILVSRVQTDGVASVAKQGIDKSKSFMAEQGVNVWFKLNQVPVLHMVAELAVPTLNHWSNKYNQIVTSLTQKGYTCFSYLPLVPVDEIAKAFKREVAKGTGSTECEGEDAGATTKQHSN